MKVIQLDRRFLGHFNYTQKIKLDNELARWRDIYRWASTMYGTLPGYDIYSKHSKNILYGTSRWGVRHSRGGYYAPEFYFLSKVDVTLFILANA